MTVIELYRSFLGELEKIYEKDEAANINDMLFENVAGITRLDLIKDPSRMLDETTMKRLDGSLQQLRLHKPIQYVTGEAWFCQMKLKVSPAVLIPRPETEELVNEVISFLKQNPRATVIDIGTGSGCIAIAIKKNEQTAAVTAVDISKEALAIAASNANDQRTEISFIQNDFLDATTWDELGFYDVIVSNPPYVPGSEKGSLDKNVTYFEPHLALFVEDERPLIFYEKIAAFAGKYLKENGKIFLETHEQLADQTAALFLNEKYSVLVKKDMQGKQRMVIVTRRSL